jgi:hypothetical protein
MKVQRGRNNPSCGSSVRTHWAWKPSGTDLEDTDGFVLFLPSELIPDTGRSELGVGALIDYIEKTTWDNHCQHI